MKKFMLITCILLISAALSCALSSCSALNKILGKESSQSARESLSESQAESQSPVESSSESESSTENENSTESTSESTAESESDSGSQHEHVYGNWLSDGDGHWKECECGDKIEQDSHELIYSEVTLPTFSTGGFASGQKCEICQKVLDSQTTYPKLSNSCGDYAYQSLATRQNGQNMQAFYSSLYDDCAEYQDDATKDATKRNDDWICLTKVYNTFNITADEAFLVLHSLQLDCPVFYWLSGKAYASSTELIICTPQEYISGEARMEYNQIVYKGLIELTPPTTTIYEKVLYLHDEMVDKMDYAYKTDGVTPEDATWAHDVIGYFQKGSGVCESYTETCHLILNYWGIDSVQVLGTAKDEYHSWNLIKLDDGKYYWFDFTWDDQPHFMTGKIYDYFCKTDANFNIGERVVDISYYDYPERSTADYEGDFPLIESAFTLSDMSFMVLGYNQVEVTDVYGSGEVEIPQSVTFMGRDFEVIAVGKSVNNILNPVFQGGITSVKLPSTIKYIRGCAFAVYSLTSVTVDENNSYIFSEGDAIYQKDPLVLICYLTGATKSQFSLKEGTVGIESWAFLFNQKLQTIVLPKSLKFINSNAFYQNDELALIKYEGSQSEWNLVQLPSGFILPCQIEYLGL